ncbi:MAG: stage II sporulation protein M [bacterium]|nr:stage II sporulation protein M [bacterium]
MEYQRFVELRTRSCDEFDQDLRAARHQPRSLSYEGLERLAFRYRQLLHDHALAAARYPGTAMARRLRRLVLEGTHWLQRDTGDHLPTLRRFLSTTFPMAMRRLLPSIALMTALFATAALFGFALTVAEPSLGATFLHPEAIEDLRHGRLWTESIFATTPGAMASTMIATNNISVALTGWAGGALAGLGALYVVLLNGMMLGSVLATTAHYSMSTGLLTFAAAHGPLEISMILVTAAAGLRVGRALVVAVDRPRSEMLQEAGRDALIVLLGCLPWILLLGFVEGFLSPSTELSLATKVLLGLLLEALFITVAWNPFMTKATPA